MELTLTNQVTLGNCDFLGFSNAQKNIKKALELQGVQITAVADKTLCHIGAHMFKPDTGKTNYLWFPYEANKINSGMVEKINRADHVIASCQHNKEVFLGGGVTRPISVCKLGIDTDVFSPAIKPVKAKKFRFLWIGNPVDMRKGWDIAARAFIDKFDQSEEVELYLKTTGKHHQDEIEIGTNIIFDSRNLSTADLIDLYESSNVLVCTSRGEATFLPGLEAMALHIPVMAPPVGGMKDFITNETAIPLEFEMVDGNFGLDLKVPQVINEDLKSKMRQCVDNYDKLLCRTRNGRKRVIDNHSLESMGERLVNIIFNNIN